jgi:hypothetical protein
MDFLDPKKERLNRIKLFVGYCLIALAIGIATLILLYQSYGYNLNQGEVTQNGLVFVSSQPTGAAIYLNGKRYKSNTNSRVVVPANRYTLSISAAGYRSWQRPITVNGGDVQHFDYPFLFPEKLQTNEIRSATETPSVTTQSPDKRWLLLGDANKTGSFEEYDLKDPTKPVLTEVSLPEGSFTPADNGNAWSVVEWAADNKHVLLQHTYTNGTAQATEYVLLDRDSSVDSVNLTTALHLSQIETVNLYNNRTDQFYVYDQSGHVLQRVNSSDGSVVSQLNNILAFKTYGSNYILYVTDKSPTGKTVSGQVSVVLQAGQKTITLRTLPAGGTYSLNLAQYSGDWYIAMAADNDTGAYIYKNPQDQPPTDVDAYPNPWRRIALQHVSYLSFSSNTQFLLAESGQDFAVYDFEDIAQYRYKATQPIDQPQLHATWMDGDRLVYVSNGKTVVFDYDYRNQQTLQAASAVFVSYFAPDYSYVYSLAPANAAGKNALNSTALTIKK